AVQCLPGCLLVESSHFRNLSTLWKILCALLSRGNLQQLSSISSPVLEPLPTPSCASTNKMVDVASAFRSPTTRSGLTSRASCVSKDSDLETPSGSSGEFATT